ncbi:MAG: hypothetical protein L3K25_10310 [Gammaproteobacteria bacterium]|nr:hypothetical protein [Gammaproteobacteria bacterium]
MSRVFFYLFVGLVLSIAVPSYADEPVEQKVEQQSSGVLQAFENDRSAKSELVAVDEETKHLIMFLMGIPLLLLIITTVALGVAMVVYGKRVFVPHMVCAGLSLTLALGHAVAGIVWFYPF